MTSYETMIKKAESLEAAALAAQDERMRIMWLQKADALRKMASEMTIEQAERDWAPVSEIKRALKQKLTSWAGYPVTRIAVHGDEVHVTIETPRGKRRVFYGYYEDIQHNYKRGLL